MSAQNQAAAVLTKASGQVHVERQGARLSLAEGDTILSTDTVVTGSDATAEVRFVDGATASLSPSTSLEVKSFAFGEGAEPSFILNLAQGTMRSVSGEVVKQNPDAFKIVTPQATVGIRGTELFTAVQPDGQEVHAVLHIGKDHIVVITGNDGSSVVMDQALQAVNVLGGAGGMQKQTFELSEMQQVIKAIAPSQVQKPIQPGGPDGAQGTEAQPADGAAPAAATGPAAATAAAATAGHSAVVVIAYSAEAQAAVDSAASSVDVNTLIQAVENLQGALADAGFSVQVAAESALLAVPPAVSVLTGTDMLDHGTFVADAANAVGRAVDDTGGLGAGGGIATGPGTGPGDGGDGAGTLPPVVPDPGPGDGGDGGGTTPPVVPNPDPDPTTVNEVYENFSGNFQATYPNAVHTITVNGNMTGDGSITTGDAGDTISVGYGPSGGAMSGGTIKAGGGVDNISIASISTENTANITVDGGAGNDSITIGSITNSGVGLLTISGGEGDDTIIVNGGIVNSGGKLVIDGGQGKDDITVNGVTTVGGTMTIDLGADDLADTVTLGGITGTVKIVNYKAGIDILKFTDGGWTSADGLTWTNANKSGTVILSSDGADTLTATTVMQATLEHNPSASGV